jgi:uncharacterized RDD family membrane protein YckC
VRGDEIVTGEAVKLELRPASFASRLLAFALDFVCLAAVTVLLVLALDLAGFGQWSQAAQIAAISALLALLLLIIPTTIETWSRGRSAGKLAAGLRVVQDDGGPVRVRQAFTRALVGVFDIWLTAGVAAFLTMLFNDRGKRVGDFLAGTYVMRARGVRLQVFALPMPPELAAWARLADIGHLSDGLALRARQFLLRLDKLSPQARARLATALASEIGRSVAPAPPLGTNPERYLAAVVCERRDRELAAAPGRAARAATLAGASRRLPYQIPDPAN